MGGVRPRKHQRDFYFMTAQYREYLKSDLWRKKANEVLKRDKCCQVCETKNNLTVHHLTYANIFRESLEELTSLCWKCHNSLHAISKKQKCCLSNALYILKSKKLCFVKNKKQKKLDKRQKVKSRRSEGEDFKAYVERKAELDRKWNELHQRPTKKKKRQPVIINIHAVDKLWKQQL